MIAVAPNGAYEDHRLNYASGKRPLTIPEGRRVEARLEQPQPDDPIRGLGRRRIPASTQRPGRPTNEAVVYARLCSLSDTHALEAEVGDVLFVGKDGTVFGSGTDRLSRCATLREMNSVLMLDKNKLKPGMVDAIVESREEMLKDATGLRDYMQATQDASSEVFNRAKTDQTPNKALAEELRYTEYYRDKLESILQEAKTNKLENTTALPYAETDWIAVPALRTWSPDGVLRSKEEDAGVIDRIIAHSGSSEKLLNVTIAGVTGMKNNRRVALEQYFGNDLVVGGILYMCLVAVPEDGNCIRFQFKLTNSRNLAKLIAAAPSERMATVEFSVDDLLLTAACWRLGVVTDDKAVVSPSRYVTANVSIRLLMYNDFWSEISGNALNWRDVQQKMQKARFPKLFTNPPIGDPYFLLRSLEIYKYVIANAGADDQGAEGGQLVNVVRTGPDPYGLFALLLSGLQYPDAPIVVVPRKPGPFQKVLFSLGYNMRKAVKEGSIVATSSIYSPSWGTKRHPVVKSLLNNTVANGVLQYTVDTLASRSVEFQTQYRINSKFLKPFVQSIDKFLFEGNTLKTYGDNCEFFLTFPDGGVTHAMCVLLSEATAGGKPLFPAAFVTRPGMSVQILTFKLPPKLGDTFTLGGQVDLSKVFEKVPGLTLPDRMDAMSFSLNYLFDLPFDTQWAPGDLGMTWSRPLLDAPSWAVARDAKLEYLEDISVNSQAIGLSWRMTDLKTGVAAFAVMAAGAVPRSAQLAIASEVAGLAPAPLPSTLTTLQDPGSLNKSGEILALVTSRPDNLTPNTACAPLRLRDEVSPLETCLWPIPDRTKCSQSVIANSSARTTHEALDSLQEAMDKSSRALSSPPSPTVPARSADPLSIRYKTDLPFGKTGSVPESQSMIDYCLAAAATLTEKARSVWQDAVLYNLDNAQAMEVEEVEEEEEEEIQYDRL